MSIRSISLLVVVLLMATACADTRGITVEQLGEEPDEDVLSPCEPAGSGEPIVMVEPSGQRPSESVMEQALANILDAQFVMEQLEEGGHTREEALHAMYAQEIGQQLFADVSPLPGFVTGAYARPLEGEPFSLAFSGSVPEEFDPDAYDLGSFGLHVTTGSPGLDHEAMAAAFDAATDAGMQVVSASGDEATGTAQIEVIDATDEQLAAWELAVDDPSRWCVIRAARMVPCDDSVIAAAEQRSARQGEVMPNEQDSDRPFDQPMRERAEEVGKSYLGLTLDASREKAEQENREVRVVVQDGVPLGATDDLQPGRLNLTVCNGVVVNTQMDLEPSP